MYKTFIRSCTNWQEFSRSRKITKDTNLTYAEAKKQCDDYNTNRTTRQIKRGTKLEFTEQ